MSAATQRQLDAARPVAHEQSSGLTRKPAGRAVSSTESSGIVFRGKVTSGERSRHVVENTPHKAGKKRLTFSTEEMRLRILKHAIALYKKGIDPKLFYRTIARREQISEWDVKDIMTGLVMQLRAENIELRQGIAQAARELRTIVEAINSILSLAEEAGLKIWRAA